MDADRQAEAAQPNLGSLLDFTSKGEYDAPSSLSAGNITDSDIDSLYQATIESMQHAIGMQIPSLKSTDTDKYIKRLGELRALYQGNQKDLDALQQQYQSATASQQAAIAQGTEAKIQEIKANQAKAQQIADIAQNMNEITGVGGNDSRLAAKIQLKNQISDSLIPLGNRSVALKESIQQDAQKLQEEQNVGFFDDPARWLEGIFTIPQMAHQIDAKKLEVGTLDSEIAGVTNTVQGIQADINENVAVGKAATEQRALGLPSLTAQQAAAQANIQAAAGTEAVAKTEQDLIKHNVEFAGIRFSEAVAENSAEAQQIRLKMEQNEQEFKAAVAQVNKADSDALAKARITTLLEKLKDRRTVEGMLRIAEKRLGMAENALTYDQFNRMSEVDRNFIAGQAIGYTGATPGDAWVNMKDADARGIHLGPLTTPQTRQMWQNAHEIASVITAASQKEEVYKGITDKNAKQAYVVQKINEYYANLQKNPTSDPQKNPFYEISPAFVVAHTPQFAQTDEGKILDGLIKSPTPPDTGQIIAAFKTANNGDPDKTARMVSNYYKLNIKVRNSLTDYGAIGIKVPDSSYVYSYKVPGTFFGSSPGKADLTKFEDVKRLLLLNTLGTE